MFVFDDPTQPVKMTYLTALPSWSCVHATSRLGTVLGHHALGIMNEFKHVNSVDT